MQYLPSSVCPGKVAHHPKKSSYKVHAPQWGSLYSNGDVDGFIVVNNFFKVQSKEKKDK